MRDVFLAAVIQTASTTGSQFPSEARAFLADLLKSTGFPGGRVQELHWLEGGAARKAAPRETWFASLLHDAGFPMDLATFTWPVSPLLPHYILHSAVRSIESGGKDAALLVQTGSTGLAGLLLVSPTAIGRHNLAPRARVALLSTLPSGEGDPLAVLAAQLERARPEKAAEPAGADVEVPGAAEEKPLPDAPLPGEVTLLASAANPLTADRNPFSSARWLELDPPAEGDLFLVEALMRGLETNRERWGLLLSGGRQGTSLATLLERL